MSIVLNEKEWVLERIFSPNPKDKKSEVLSRLTKFYSSEGLSKSETARRLEEYLLCLDSAVSLPKWSKTIERYVKKHYGEPLLQIDFIPISKEELEVIDSLKGEQTKRLAFTLLCLSKYQRKLNRLNDYWVCVKESEIMRLANINTSLERRCAMFSYLNECGLIEFSKRIDNTNVRVCFADSGENEDREPVLEQTELRSETPPEIVAFWGSGYSDDMYKELEERRLFWMSRFPKGTKLDIGTEALIRQICALELDINRDRFEGKPIDKSVNALNTLLGSANLRPTQTKSEDNSAFDKTPFGVWVRKLENERPVSEPSEDMKDVDGIVRYISVWFLGHLCKMLKIKNSYSRLYEEEIEKLRVSHPEYEDDDDESLVYDIFAANGEEQNED